MGGTAQELGATGAEMLVPQQEMDAGTRDTWRGQGTLRALAHALLGEGTRSNGEHGPCQ